MEEQKIRNMRVISDDPTLLHVSSFGSVPVGEVHTMYGRKYRAIDNWQTTIVTFEPIEAEEGDIDEN